MFLLRITWVDTFGNPLGVPDEIYLISVDWNLDLGIWKKTIFIVPPLELETLKTYTT